VSVRGSIRELARLGDAIVNFVASAVLTLKEGRPCGIRVPDALLRRVASRVGLGRLGSVGAEDVLEAVVAYAWLRGFSVERMVEIALEGARREGVEEGLAALLGRLSQYRDELLQQVRGG